MSVATLQEPKIVLRVDRLRLSVTTQLEPQIDPEIERPQVSVGTQQQAKTEQAIAERPPHLQNEEGLKIDLEVSRMMIAVEDREIISLQGHS